MTRISWTAAVLAVALSASASAKDAASFPEGASTQTFGDHTFDMAVPKSADVKPPYSLLVVIAGGGAGAAAADLVPLTKDGYVVVTPQQKLAGGMWATSEVKDILDFAEHVSGAFSIPPDRRHILTFNDHRGFASFVAFDKKATFVSYSLVDTTWSGQSPPADAKKRLGVLAMGRGEERRGDPGAIVKALTGKVRSVEYRADGSPFTPYYRYWLGVMEGRFKPGFDLSFDWVADADPPAAAVKAGPKDPPPAAKPALDTGRASAKSKGVAAFVYFWSADDLAKPEAKALQNEVFFDENVRSAAKPLVAVKLERAKYQEAFAAFGLKTTPAVVVVDTEFDAIDRFEGAVAAKALAKSLTTAAALRPK
jgi:hypothetical protein